ncbi:hypothetical protein DTO212C5_90 [Paecilomyces variotii]|nr:hypothetical protein DTO212C5_90 [Paecilomyces variotii]
MADRLPHLIREIEHVVTAPYIPVLQDLQELVSNCPLNVLEVWASCKPCQVALLAQKLLEAIPCSSASLPLICAFAQVQEFCEILVQKQPALLDQLLQKAIDDRDSQSFQTCISILSHPLPSGIVLPARVSTFVERLVQKMVDKPSAETIYPLYQVIGSMHGSSSLLAAFSEETMANFQTECTKILRNLDDHMGNLLCLATFARIAAARTPKNYTGQGNDGFPNWLQNIRQFFGPKRSSKTLDLVVLRVILACSANFNMSSNEAIQSVRLAMEICDAVDSDQRRAWIEKNAARITKLREKLGREGIDRKLQVMGLAFLVSFLSNGQLSEDHRAACKEILLSDEGRRALQELPDNAFRVFVSQAMTYLDDAAVSDLLQYAFSLIKEDEFMSNDALLSIQIMLRILSAMRQSNLGLLAHSAFRFISSDSGTELLSSRMKSFPMSCQGCCEGADICRPAFVSMQNSLFVDLVFLSCTSTLSDNPSSTSPSTFPMLASCFSMVKKSVSEKCHCSFSSSNRSIQISMSLNATAPVRFEVGASKDWRAKMGESLMQNACSSHESIIQKVGEICRDLEYRCHNVEAPLRDVTDQRDQLASEVEALKRHNRELGIRVEQSSHAALTLQQEMTRLKEEADSATARSQYLATQLAAAQKELEDEKRDSQETAVSERQKARSRELDLIATLTEKEDRVEELHNELNHRSAENERLRETIETLSEKNTSGSEMIASLRQEVDELQQSVDNKTSDNNRMDSEIKALVSDRDRLRSERDDLQHKLEIEVSESNRLRIAMREEEESHQSKVAMLEQQYQSELSRVTAQALQETSRLTEEINLLRIALQAAETKVSSERKESSRKINKLQQKIEALRNERAAKAREFAEAQEHISRLMGVMGFKNDRKDTTKPTSREERSKPALKTSNFRESLNLAEDSVNDTSFQENTQLGASFGSTASSNYAPTPKRSKGSRGSRALSHASLDDGYDDRQSRKSHSSGSHSGTTRKERHRKPLGECDRNSPAKSSQSTTSKECPDEEVSTQLESQICTQVEEQQLENASLGFSDEDIFTSMAARLTH